MTTKKKLQETHTETLNSETGEVEQQSNTKVFSIPSEPPFIKLYLDDIERIYDLPANSSSMLYELLKKLDYEGRIALNSTTKKRICERTGYKMQTLNNYIQKLLKKEIFIREGTGVYVPDPHLFGRGDWKEIHKRREAWLHISYKNGKREVSTSFEEEQQQEPKHGVGD